MDQNEQIQYSLPIAHLSYSALRLYCSNRQLFKKNYIEGRYDRSKESMVALVGSGFHKVMEMYYSGMSIDDAIQQGYKVINDVPAEKLNFEVKKRETLLQEMAKAVQFYMENPLDLGKIEATETAYTTDLFLNDELMPLPLKAKADIISRKDDGLHIYDWKVVTSFSIKEDEDGKYVEKPDYIVQGMFNYFVTKQVFNEAPKDITFVEIKKTANTDKLQSQIQIYKIIFAEHPDYFTHFTRLYEGFLLDILNANLQYLPNFGDPFNGAESWEEFVSDPDLDFGIQKDKIKHIKAISIPASPFVVSGKIKVTPETVATLTQIADPSPANDIISKFAEFGVPLTHVQEHKGPSVTLHTFKPSRGVTMAKIKQYEDDVMIALGAKSVRIIAPIAGTQTIGVEIDNKERDIVDFEQYGSVNTGDDKLNIPVGVDVYGKTELVDLIKAPHLLVAGTTGSGKSVFLNILLESLPKNVQTIVIDPKGNEFLDSITEIADIHQTLDSLIKTMNDRYKTMRDSGVKDIRLYNQKSKKKMKRIVVVVDEMADIFLSKETFEQTTSAIATRNRKGDVVSTSERTKDVKYGTVIKESIIQLAQKSRAAGIHLVLATQRPSVDVVDGILKANLPTRIAFMTVTETDSKVILDQSGAERLLGNGDLLLMMPGNRDLIRLQGLYKE